MVVVQCRTSSTIGESLSTRDNALNFIRLVLASAVIIGHAPPIMGRSAPPEIVELGNWAVNGFFLVSGYLIAGSRMRLGVLPYLWRRALRIFPAYWVALLLVAGILAPLTALVTGESLIWRSAVAFPVRNALLIQAQPEVANVLMDTPIPHVWLGTAWTLAYEFVAYLICGALLSLGIVRRHGASSMALAALLLTVKPPGVPGE